MRRLVSLLAATGIAAATALVAAPAAGAATDPVPSPPNLRTTVKTLPGIAPAIVKAGVLPYAVSPGKLSGATLSPLTLSFSFPITKLTGGTFAGNIPNEIEHQGGIAFVKLGSLTKRIVVKDFTIDLNGGTAVGQKNQPQLIGTVTDGPGGVPDGARVALFDIDLGSAKIDATQVQVTGAQLKLTAEAGAALDAELGTKLFRSVIGAPIFSARANA
jgi:hypothetical protein